MKTIKEEVAYNLLWMRPGMRCWFRQACVGPAVICIILDINTDHPFPYVLCRLDEDADTGFNHAFKVGLHEPKHMSIYPEGWYDSG